MRKTKGNRNRRGRQGILIAVEPTPNDPNAVPYNIKIDPSEFDANALASLSELMANPRLSSPSPTFFQIKREPESIDDIQSDQEVEANQICQNVTRNTTVIETNCGTSKEPNKNGKKSNKKTTDQNSSKITRKSLRSSKLVPPLLPIHTEPKRKEVKRNTRSRKGILVTVEPTPNDPNAVPYNIKIDPNDLDILSEVMTNPRLSTPSPTFFQIKREPETIDESQSDQNVESNQIGRNIRRKSISIVDRTEIESNLQGRKRNKTKIAEKITNQISTRIPKKSIRIIKPLPSLPTNKKDRTLTHCDLCENKPFANNRNYRKHMINKHYRPQKFPCDACDKIFSSTTSLKYHMELHANKVYVCELCKFQTLHNRQLEKHVIKRHTIREKTFKCDKCYRWFYTFSNLKSHRLVHDEKSFFCDICTNGYSSKVSLLKHIKLSHLLVDNAECEHCGKKFSQRSSMLEHKKVIHLNLKPYECNRCDKKFGRPSALSKHMTIHTGIRKHVCDKCKKSFTCRSSLKTHINQHHLSIKPYKCDVCAKTFARADYLQKHRLLHTGEKPFQCDICHKYVSRWSNMRSHLLAHERIRSRFACNFCPLKFLRDADLQAHACAK